MKSTMESTIEALVQTVSGGKTVREQFLLRESLRNLVRMAKAEQMAEIKGNAARLTRNITEGAAKRKAKVDNLFRLTAASDLLQQRLQFGDDLPANAASRSKVHGSRYGN